MKNIDLASFLVLFFNKKKWRKKNWLYRSGEFQLGQS